MLMEALGENRLLQYVNLSWNNLVESITEDSGELQALMSEVLDKKGKKEFT